MTVTIKTLSVLFMLGLQEGQAASAPGPVRGKPETAIKVCSFNIQWIGISAKRDNEGLAELLKRHGCDLVVVQELVAPPSAEFLKRNHLKPFKEYRREAYDRLPAAQKRQLPPPDELVSWQIPMSQAIQAISGMNPTEEACQECTTDLPVKPSDKSTRFFKAMADAGFRDFILSESDTGPKTIRTNGSASEWWVTFFDPEKVKVAPDLPHGFLSPQLAGPREYERTPYAFPFRTRDGKFDFVIVSTHLRPGAAEAERRGEELRAISRWKSLSRKEKDFIPLGDMNIESRGEFEEIVPRRPDGTPEWETLNRDFVATNTNLGRSGNQRSTGKPYDHVLVDRKHTRPEEVPGNFEVINLHREMRDRWALLNPGLPYPGGDERGSGYDHDEFRATYSDHHPVAFEILSPGRDDDGRSRWHRLFGWIRRIF